MTFAVAAQSAVGCELSVTMRIVSPSSGGSTQTAVPLRTRVQLHVEATGFESGMRLVVRARALGFGGPFVPWGECRRASCEFFQTSDKQAGGEYVAVIVDNSGERAISETVYVRWELKKLTFEYTVPDRFTDVTVTASSRTSELLRPKVWNADLAVTDCPDPTKAGTTYAWTYAPVSGSSRPLRANRTAGCTWRAEFDGPAKAKDGNGEGAFQVKLVP